MESAGERYTAAARALHWLIATLVFVELPLGLLLNEAPDPITKFKWFQLHKSIGITILLVMILRLLWRLIGTTPKLPATLAWLERRGAQVAHFTFYVLLLALPLTGWIIVSTSELPVPTLLFQTVPWSHIPFLVDLPAGEKAALHRTFKDVHSMIAYLLIFFIVLHVCAALYHALFLKDDVLARMLPRWKRRAVSLLALGLGAWLLMAESAPARAAEWSVKPEESRIGFEAMGSGYTTKGAFSRFKCVIEFDPDSPADAAVTVHLDMKSASTGVADVDGTLATAEFFAPQQFPIATFSARGARELGDGRYALDGQLTLKGVTKPLSLPFIFSDEGGLAKVKAEATINRLDFGVGPQTIAGMAIDHQVKVLIELTALRLDN